jgi:hypothetical protein
MTLNEMQAKRGNKNNKLIVKNLEPTICSDEELKA